MLVQLERMGRWAPSGVKSPGHTVGLRQARRRNEFAEPWHCATYCTGASCWTLEGSSSAIWFDKNSGLAWRSRSVRALPKHYRTCRICGSMLMSSARMSQKFLIFWTFTNFFGIFIKNWSNISHTFRTFFVYFFQQLTQILPKNAWRVRIFSLF